MEVGKGVDKVAKWIDMIDKADKVDRTYDTSDR